MTDVILSIHDVSPATAPETGWWVSQIERLGVRATLLVIPGPWRGESMSTADPLAGSLRKWQERGHEISLHGWNHTQPGKERIARIVARGAGEFAHLGASDSESRLTAGLRVLDVIGLAASGFTPPGWLISTEAKDSVERAGIAYFTTHSAIHHLDRRRVLDVPAVCHRPGSLLSRAGAVAMRTGVRWSLSSGRDLRVAIHPDDTHHQHLRSTTLFALRAALDAGCRVLPYKSYLETA